MSDDITNGPEPKPGDLRTDFVRSWIWDGARWLDIEDEFWIRLRQIIREELRAMRDE